MDIRFTDICFITDDVLKLRSFYEAVFGAAAEGDEWHSALPLDGFVFVFDSAKMLQDSDSFRYVSGKSSDNTIISFNVEDVDAEYARLLSLNIETINKPTTHPWGARSFQFRDPDGNILNFRSITKKEEHMDIYEHCPTLETKNFTLRLVREEDAADLFGCYNDVEAVELMNDDNCDFGFYMDSLDKMSNCIHYWLDAYKKHYYIRFAIIDKQSGRAVGTVEMFGAKDFLPEGSGGVLRVDIASHYETEEYLYELLNIADVQFYDMFDVETIVTKANPVGKARVNALHNAGYSPFDWKIPGRDHYYSKVYRKK